MTIPKGLPDTCGTCIFYSEPDYNGECKRHAPIAIQDLRIGDAKTVFPKMHLADLCGDFIKQEEEK